MKVGLCGLGDRLSYLAGTFSELIADFELVAYADPGSSRLRYMLDHGIENMSGYDHIDAMLASEDLDLLMVGSPNHLHLEHIGAGLRAGLRVFTEKPVVATEAQTFELLDLLKEYGVASVTVGLVLRYSPLYKDLYALVSGGELGDIASIEANEHIPPDHGAFFMRDWRRLEAYSGGFILEKCCHDLDLYQGVMGCRARNVASFGGRRSFTPDNAAGEKLHIYHEWKTGWRGSDKVFTSDSDLIDYQTAIVRYENDASLCFHLNLNAPDPHRRFCVIGSHGMAEGDFVRNYFKVHHASSKRQLVDRTYDYGDLSMHYGAEERMAAELETHFRTGAALPVSVLDALEAGLTALKIDEARKSGQVVDLAELWARFDDYGLASPKEHGRQAIARRHARC